MRKRSRIIDIFGSLLLLCLTLPILLFAALAIILEDRGPVFYRQIRVGFAGRPFTVVKLRTMRGDAEADGVARWSFAGDRRVTRVGRIMRRHRIDELPQLFNVLAGSMSLVGPRPERPAFVEQLASRIPGYHARHTVRPGVTGLAQVNLGYAGSIDDAHRKHAHDLAYLARRSIALDLAILAKTVIVCLRPSP